MPINSLRYRFALIISLVAGLLLTLVIWLSISMSHRVSHSQLETKEEVFSAFLLDMTRGALLQGEYEVLQLYLEKLKADPEIIEIRVADSRGVIVSSTVPAELGSRLPSQVNDEINQVTRRAIRNETGLIGTVETTFSHAEIETQHRRVLKASVLIALAGIGLVVGISLALGFLLTRRLVHLTEAATQLAQGDLSVQVDLGGSSGDEIGILGDAFNTMARRMETMVKELRNVNATLEERVQERTNLLESANHELEKARDAAQIANVAKGSFLANMSHEIRTPMNAILGMTHLALKTELSPRQREYLRKVNSSAESLLGIINDILDFSKIEAGRLEMENQEFLLEEMLDKVAMLVSGKMLEKRLEFLVELDPDIPFSLKGDSLRLGQVLVNLCNNAAKFTEQGEIVLRARMLRQSGDQVRLRFSVRDTGIGMSQDMLARLFRPFTQADASTTRKYGGTGLGLAICKQLVEMMDGEFSVSSVPGQGSEFSFTACLGLGRLAPRPLAASASGLRGRRILVVDDNPTARDIFESQLVALDFTVASVDSADAAMAALQEAELCGQPYHLVIMDWLMPAVDGFEAARRIRRSHTLRQRPRIIMATAYGCEDTIRRAAAEGLDGYITKPTSPSVLLDSIMAALSRENGEHAALSVATNQAGEKEAPALAALHGGRVLLVEDNDFNRQVAMELLTSFGLQVTTAENGAEAVSLLCGLKPDLVFMDIQMPVMDGFEATRRLRLLPEGSHVPIVAMTAHAMASDRESCLQAGMDDYLSKPIDPEQMKAVLLKWIQPAAPPLDTGAEPVSVAAVRLPESLTGIDLAKGLRYSNNKPDFYLELLRNFARARRQADEEIRQALDKGEHEVARRYAHSLKSICGIIGAEGLAQAAGRLETALKDSQKDPAGALDEFSGQLSVLIQALDSCPELTPGRVTDDGESADAGLCLLAAREIDMLLDSDLPGAMRHIDALEKWLAGGSLRQELTELKDCLDVFDIDQAHDILARLIDGLRQEGIELRHAR
ncbi:MAG: response regulator [Desulfuromonadales bacterium]